MERKSKYKILDLILHRWSPRALSGEPITDEQLMTLFEAARWAPSSFDNQPWRFIYAKRNTISWDRFFNLLAPANQVWAKNAAVLILEVSHKHFEYNETTSRTHSFDAGAAWENLALQAFSMGLVAHGMEGFDYDRAQKELKISDHYQVEAMIAVGKPGKKEDLPEKLQKSESPNERKPLEEIIFEGFFKENKK